ncbi:unnamed protein product [Lactuca saligna]|uniref:Uncharacterized protein n=1 Tax=Lactuca saligna TaxID=75948 RepID=A0AA36E090_LACSI|nr:unnamed protein product [Lactuca saligna]
MVVLVASSLATTISNKCNDRNFSLPSGFAGICSNYRKVTGPSRFETSSGKKYDSDVTVSVVFDSDRVAAKFQSGGPYGFSNDIGGSLAGDVDQVTVVRTEEICLSGGLTRQKMKYLHFLHKHMNTKSYHGPIHFRDPSKILWCTIRGQVATVQALRHSATTTRERERGKEEGFDFE